MEEVWKDIPNSDHEISLSGLVKNKLTGKILMGGMSCYGYPCVAIQKGGKRRQFLLHRLLLEVFVCPCPIGMEARHLDGNRLNHSLDNLKWGIRSENMRDRTRNGWTSPARSCNRGYNNASSKLSDEKVLEIDSLIQQGIPHIEIAEQFGVCARTITLIKHRKSWLHLWNKPATPESNQ